VQLWCANDWSSAVAAGTGAVADGGSHGGAVAFNTQEFGTVDSPFNVYAFNEECKEGEECEDTSDTLKRECGISEEQYTALLNTRFRKVVCPFGVVIAGTDLYPTANIKYAANVVANLLDPTGTGEA